jgi:hypothetical protein
MFTASCPITLIWGCIVAATSKSVNMITADYLKEYMQKTRSDAEEARRIKAINDQAKAKRELANAAEKARKAVSLEQQITQYLATLPPVMRNRPWRIDDLLPHLTGRVKERPHHWHIGAALKRLGWSRKRLYGGDYGAGGCRVWIPPIRQ